MTFARRLLAWGRPVPDQHRVVAHARDRPDLVESEVGTDAAPDSTQETSVVDLGEPRRRLAGCGGFDDVLDATTAGLRNAALQHVIGGGVRHARPGVDRLVGLAQPIGSPSGSMSLTWSSTEVGKVGA